MATPLRVLILEDQPADATLMARELARAGFAADWRRVDDEPGYLEGLGDRPDVILADYTLPRFDAVRALRILRERALDVPLIVVTGSVGEEVAVECMREGAADYLLKDRLARLGPAVARVLDEHRLGAEKRRAEAALRESEARFRRLAENAPDLIYRYRLAAPAGYEYVSPAALRITGYAPEEYYADPALLERRVHPDDRPRLRAWTADPRGWSRPLALRCVRKDGAVIWTEHRGGPVFDEAGALVAAEGVVRDVSEQKQGEAAAALLAAIVESSTDAVMSVSLDGTITTWNAAAERLYGYAAAEAVGQPVALVVPPERRAELGPLHARLGRGERIEAFETVRRRKDGTLVDVALSIAPLRDGSGRIWGSSGIARDVTSRKRAEAALRESEERFRRAFEDAATGMALQGLDGRYLRVNQALCRMLGYSAEELLGTSFHAVTHPEDREKDAAFDRRVLAGEPDSYHTEKRYLHRAGGVVWAQSSVSPVRSAEGQPLYFVVQAQDITERRQAEAAQARLQAQLVQSEKVAAMGQLLAGVAHELNNSLSVVLGQAALLRQKAGDGPLATRAEKIAQAAERCARIVRNFLALARQRPPERQLVLLNRVVEEALELVSYGLRVDDVEVALDLTTRLPSLWADPHQLHQVVINLVSNAHHALRQAPLPRRLTLATGFDPERDLVWLEVRDTGPGIPDGARSHIFEPFFTTKPPGQGTGLGLSLCQGIVETHEGRIHVESAPGQGTAFRVELPATRLAPRAREAEGRPAGPVRGKTILVVDDEPEIAAMLAEMLAEDGHAVETAANGAIALRRLAERRYDLVISDLKMPELDGPGLYRQAAGRDPALRDRFVFLTGDALYQETRAFLEETPALSMSKPFSTNEVLQVVRRALAGREPAG